MTATEALRELRSGVRAGHSVAATQAGPRPGRSGDARRHPRADELWLVPDAASLRRERRARLFTALAALGVCFGLFGVVGVQVMLAQGQTEVQRLQEQVTQEQERQQHLRLQAAELEAPSRIVAAARDQLGMVSPTTVVALAPASLDDPPPTTIAPAPATARPTTIPAARR